MLRQSILPVFIELPQHAYHTQVNHVLWRSNLFHNDLCAAVITVGSTMIIWPCAIKAPVDSLVDYNDVLGPAFVAFGHVMKSPSLPKETTTTLKARHKQIK